MELYPVLDVLPSNLLGSGFDDVAMTTSAIDEVRAFRNISEYLQSYLGSRYRSLTESIALTVVYCLVFTTGIIGNVVHRSDRLETAVHENCYELLPVQSGNLGCSYSDHRYVHVSVKVSYRDNQIHIAVHLGSQLTSASCHM